MGRRAAIIYTLVECAKRHGHNPEAYLADVPERIPAMTNQDDLVPDQDARTLTITLHSLSTPGDNAVIGHLCSELNGTETLYPGTDLRMIFRSVSS